ncbi:uncharacterized protein LOC111269690 isoform X2 [Varroa jacobsoni]|uniref:uncharacterized protein LOC111269690 isoform X2 n=1 Tax=Varroa jacobsoni TaxID=62625 RepID=UPI000BF47175|nr:uncharacterized protein LOC111269690 isoform X2 [Varroa jacobsoni]
MVASIYCSSMQLTVLFAAFCLAALIVTPEQNWAAFTTDTEIGLGLASEQARQPGSALPALHRTARVLHLGQLGAPLPGDMSWDDDSIISHNMHHQKTDKEGTEERNAPYWTAGKEIPEEAQTAERRGADHLGREVVNGVAYLKINHGIAGSGTQVPSASLHYSQVPLPIAPTQTSGQSAHAFHYVSATDKSRISQSPNHEDLERTEKEDERDLNKATVTPIIANKELTMSQEYFPDDGALSDDIEARTPSHELLPPDATITQSHFQTDEEEKTECCLEETMEKRGPSVTTTFVTSKPDITAPKLTKANVEKKNYHADEVTTLSTDGAIDEPTLQQPLENIKDSQSNQTNTHHKEFENDYVEKNTTGAITTKNHEIGDFPTYNDNNTEVDIISGSSDSALMKSTRNQSSEIDTGPSFGTADGYATTVSSTKNLPREIFELYDSNENIQSTPRNSNAEHVLTEQKANSEITTEPSTINESTEPAITETTAPQIKLAVVLADKLAKTVAQTIAMTEANTSLNSSERLHYETETELALAEMTTGKSEVQLPTSNRTTERTPEALISDINGDFKKTSISFDQAGTPASSNLSRFVTINSSISYDIVRKSTDALATTQLISPEVESSSSNSLPITKPSEPERPTIDPFRKTPAIPRNDFVLGLEGLFQLKFRPGSQSEMYNKIKSVRHPKMIDTAVNAVSNGHDAPARTSTVSPSSSSSPHGTQPGTKYPQTTNKPTTIATVSSPLVMAPAPAGFLVNSIPSLFSNGDPSANLLNFPWGPLGTKNDETRAEKASETEVMTPNPQANTPPLNPSSDTFTPTPNIAKVNLFTKRPLPMVASTRDPFNGPSRKFNVFASLTNATNFSYSGSNIKLDHRRPKLRPLASPSIGPVSEYSSPSNESRPQIEGEKPRFGRLDRHITIVQPRAPPVPPPPVVPAIPEIDYDADLIHRGTPPTPRNRKQPISTRARTTLLMSASLITGAAVFFATLLAVCRRRAKNARLLRRRAVEDLIHDAASEASSSYGYGESTYSYGHKGLLPL